MSDYESVLILKNGGRWDFWVSQVAVVGRYVDAHAKELTKVQTPFQAVFQTPMAPSPQVERAPAAGAHLIWDPTRGGMRMPHLHYGGEIYMLNAAQWAEFSTTAVSALTEKLAKSQKVSFERLMQFSEAITGI